MRLVFDLEVSCHVKVSYSGNQGKNGKFLQLKATEHEQYFYED